LSTDFKECEGSEVKLSPVYVIVSDTRLHAGKASKREGHFHSHPDFVDVKNKCKKMCYTLNSMSKGWSKAAIPNPRGSLSRLQAVLGKICSDKAYKTKLMELKCKYEGKM